MTQRALRQLSSARLELASDVRARGWMRVALVGSLVVLAIAASAQLLADGAASTQQQSRLLQENSALQAELALVLADLELERATRSALDAQVADLNRRIAELERQLAFVNAQGGKPRRAASPN